MTEPVPKLPPIQRIEKGIRGLFGGNGVGQQLLLWNVGAQLAGALLTPTLQATQSTVWRLDPNMPASPALLAELVARGFMKQNDAYGEASSSGIGPKVFDKMVSSATRAPDLSYLMEGVRRGLIAETGFTEGSATLMQGLQDAGIRPEYWDLIVNLRTEIPTVAEVMNAWLEGQITEDEAARRYAIAGGDPTWFKTAYRAQGSAPSPVELGVMLNRGLIPYNDASLDNPSFVQGFLQGPWRNQWLTPMKGLSEYFPPARTITALLHGGNITDAMALEWFKHEGLSQETATIYVQAAHHAKAQATKNLTKSEVLTLYKDHLITHPEAAAMLGTLGYADTEANYELAAADFTREVKLLTATVSKVHSMYVGHKITKQAATNDLNTIGVPGADVADIFKHWDIERDANVHQLTAGQIAAGFINTALTQAEATVELVNIGVTVFDAWVLLSIANKGPLPDKPPRTTMPPGVNP